MKLFAEATSKSVLSLGKIVLRAIEQLPTDQRRLHLIGFDQEDWRVSLTTLSKDPRQREILEQLASSKPPRVEAALFALAVCGVARFAWERGEGPGLTAFWPLVTDKLQLVEPDDDERVARAFIESSRALNLERAEGGHYRVHTAFRNAGWPHGLFEEFFQRLANHDPDLTSPSIKLQTVMSSMAITQQRTLIEKARELIQALDNNHFDSAETLPLCEQLSSLGLDEEPKSLLQRVESIFGGNHSWQWGLQLVPGQPRHRLVLWHPLETFLDQGVNRLTGPGGGTCAVPPTRGLRYLAVPQPWNGVGSVNAVNEKGQEVVLGRRAWPEDILAFALSDHEQLMVLEPHLSSQTMALVTLEGLKVFVGDKLLSTCEPLRGTDGAVWYLPPDPPLPLEIRDEDGTLLTSLDYGRQSVSLHLRSAAPRTRGPDVGLVCDVLPEVSSQLTQISLCLESMGKSTLDNPLEVTLQLDAPLGRVPLEQLMPSASTAFGQLRLSATSAGSRTISRRFFRIPIMVTGRPEHGSKEPRVWLRDERGAGGHWKTLSQEKGWATLTLALEYGQASLSWPYRPRQVIFDTQESLNQGDMNFPRWMVDQFAEAAHRGSMNDGLLICAPVGSCFRWRMFERTSDWWQLGSRGIAEVPVGILHSWLLTSIPDYRQRLEQQRFAVPFTVDLKLPDEDEIIEYKPLGLWGRLAPRQADISLRQGKLEVVLFDVPDAWMERAKESLQAEFSIIPHGQPAQTPQRITAEVMLEGENVRVSSTVPVQLPGRSSIRTRVKGWPRRFALHVDHNGQRIDATAAYLYQLEQLLARAGCKRNFDRVMNDQQLDNAAKVRRTMRLAAASLQSSPSWPPTGAMKWLVGEVGEEPYLATPLPMLLAQTLPGQVLEVAARSVAMEQVSLEEGAAWLRDLELDPWLIRREDLLTVPSAVLQALSVWLVEKPRVDPITDGWYRLPLLQQLSRPITNNAAILASQLSLLQLVGLPLFHFQELLQQGSSAQLAPWPTERHLRQIKSNPNLGGSAQPFAQLWRTFQQRLREQGRPPLLPRKGIPSRSIKLPPHISRDETFRAAGQLAGTIGDLAIHWSKSRSPWSMNERETLDRALHLGPTFFALTVLSSDLIAGDHR